jgi:hypothetical protein
MVDTMIVGMIRNGTTSKKNRGSNHAVGLGRVQMSAQLLTLMVRVVHL